jgi:hypothetical protein
MTRKQTTDSKSQVYRVLVGIERETDETYERYEPGAIVDLSQWPADVLATWVEQRIVEPVKAREQ